MKKFLIWLGIILASIIAIYLIIAAIAPKSLQVEEQLEMDAPANMVYNVVSDLDTWPSWSPWHQRDTAMVIKYGDVRKGLNAYSEWTSESEGNGNQKFVEVVPGESIKTEMHFEGFDGANYANWAFSEMDGKTKVSWNMDGAEMPFLYRPMVFLMKGMVSDSYKQGLANIKTIVEKRANEKIYDGYKINEVMLEERHFVLNRQEIPMANITQFYQQNLGSLFGKVQKAGIEMDGMPCGLFFKWDEKNNTTDMAASIPVAEAVNIKGASSLSIPAKKALQVDYYGDYSGTAAAHSAIDKYMSDYGLLNDVPMIEEYLSDPMEEKDPQKWLTRLTYYLAE